MRVIRRDVKLATLRQHIPNTPAQFALLGKPERDVSALVPNYGTGFDPDVDLDFGPLFWVVEHWKAGPDQRGACLSVSEFTAPGSD